MLIEFKVSIIVEPEDGDELSGRQYGEFDDMVSEFEEIVGKRSHELNEAVWEVIE